jgi:hypothetical protein
MRTGAILTAAVATHPKSVGCPKMSIGNTMFTRAWNTDREPASLYYPSSRKDAKAPGHSRAMSRTRRSSTRYISHLLPRRHAVAPGSTCWSQWTSGACCIDRPDGSRLCSHTRGRLVGSRNHRAAFHGGFAENDTATNPTAAASRGLLPSASWLHAISVFRQHRHALLPVSYSGAHYRIGFLSAVAGASASVWPTLAVAHRSGSAATQRMNQNLAGRLFSC